MPIALSLPCCSPAAPCERSSILCFSPWVPKMPTTPWWACGSPSASLSANRCATRAASLRPMPFLVCSERALEQLAGFARESDIDNAPSLLEYESRLEGGGLLLATRITQPSDYPECIAVVLSKVWQGLPERMSGPREVLKLLSVLPRNESIPFELLALMVDVGDDPADERVRIDFVRSATIELSATGLAEQPEEDAVRIHPVVHEFAAGEASGDSEFVERALRAAADRLHERNFYAIHEEKDLIRRGEQLRLLREPSRLNPRLSRVVGVFDAQLDYLREGYDALAQLSMQARLEGGDELAEALEHVRLDREGPWFRLRWHSKHERGHDPKAAGHSDAVSAVAIWPESTRERGPTGGFSLPATMVACTRGHTITERGSGTAMDTSRDDQTGSMYSAPATVTPSPCPQIRRFAAGISLAGSASARSTVMPTG